MKNTYEYQQTCTFDAELEIEDTGNCAIVATTSRDNDYYLIITTQLGWTIVIQYGPSISISGILPSQINYSYKKFEYSEYKIDKVINAFLNPSQDVIISAKTIDIEEAALSMKNLVEYVT